MTIINQKKCTLYLKLSNSDGATGAIEYHVEPKPTTVTNVDDQMLYEFTINVNNPPPIRIVVTQRTGTSSHIIVSQITYNNQLITDLNSIGVMRPKVGECRRTHGYIDTEGEFVIKLHTNPVSLNYLSYLLSLTKTY